MGYSVYVNEQKMIEGKAEANCYKTPRSHNLTLWLEKKIKKKWVRQTGRVRSARIPGAKPVTLYVTAMCVKGKWRPAVRTTGVNSVGKAWEETMHGWQQIISRKACGFD